MLKVVVFDSGCGGKVVADYLAQELGIVEVVRVIDGSLSLTNRTLSEICRFSKACLRTYANQVDLIVLGGYVVSLALEFLEQEYPQQKFVSVGVNYYRILNARAFPDQVAIMADNALVDAVIRKEVCNELPYSTLILPDCSGWNELIDEGRMSVEVLRSDLGPYFALYRGRTSIPSPPPPDQPKLFQPDVVLLLNTHLWGMKTEFEQVFGYRARVLDFRQKLLHDTCRALGLRGVDGCRSK